MADSRAQQTLPFEPPVQRTATPPEPEPAREVGVDQLTGFLFDEFARRDAMLRPQRHDVGTLNPP